MSLPMRNRMGKSRSRRRGFSLAELMIAFAVLAMGLLVIGAALPIGVRYTQESANLATGEAAAEYALDLVEQNVCLLKGSVLDVSGNVDRQNSIFVPRYGPADGGPVGALDPKYEPVIKVRPLYTQNLDAEPGANNPIYPYNRAELLIVNKFHVTTCREADTEGWLRPALSWADVVYPPITFQGDQGGNRPYYPRTFFISGPVGGWPSNTQALRPYAREGRDRKFSWTVFYRRVSYEDGSDPALYELIAVVTRLPTENHRFPLQSENAMLTGLRGASAQALGDYGDRDTAAPIPWLVTFDRVPQPSGGFINGMPADAANPPATISFRCWAKDSGLFVKGSIIIPARNDVSPDAIPSPQNWIHFAPDIGTSLPIYEVVDRPDDVTVVVKYNGFYPCMGKTPSVNEDLGKDWPAWVIPPAFSEMAAGKPLLEDKSPIVAVSRRYVRLREVP